MGRIAKAGERRTERADCHGAQRRSVIAKYIFYRHNVAMDPAKHGEVWAFDLGKGSLGETVRTGNEFLHAASWLIPAEFGSIKSAAIRRRMWRTRLAHRAREERLQEVLRQAGVEVLNGRRVERVGAKWLVIDEGDERLRREFPRRGDGTCYTSCLLRIKLLRAENLESWQIYKALHSAIQRRGYSRVPWANKTGRKRTEDEESDTQQRAEAFVAALEQMAPCKPEFQFPCYLEAYRMGLWAPEAPDELRLRIDHTAGPARNKSYADSEAALVAPRDLVIRELRTLLERAAIRFPALAGRADYIMFGPGEKEFASYDPHLRRELNLREGGATDWLGVLGQKIPRFDNRIIDKCALIPRLNVCSASVRDDPKTGQPHPDSLLASEVTFLLKLKNIRVQRPGREALSAKEIVEIFDDPKRKGLSFTESQWKNWCVKRLGCQPAAMHEEIEAPRNGGRSRFCRPALRILKRLILSGESPAGTAYDRELKLLAGNTDSRRGLVPEDLAFLKKMGGDWEKLHVPNQQLDALIQRAADSDASRAIRELIGRQNDPIVRHRMTVFWERLIELEQRFGRPEEVVLEFVREDFMGEKARIEYRAALKKRSVERKRARENAVAQGFDERSAATKWELLAAQGFRCVYTDEPLGQTPLDQLQIEHIVPRGRGGPDAMVNYVVTTHATNMAKGPRTPHEWLSSTNGWDAYVQRVQSRAGALGRTKARLLTSPDAPEIVQRRTALAETAWIARLAQTLVTLHFGWAHSGQEGERRVTVVSGGLTARIRRKYRLNSLLHPAAADEEEAEQKNRNDDRHHALDAMVISYLPQWVRDPGKEGFFRFPDALNVREFFGSAIAQVVPESYCFEQAALDETIYGARRQGEHKVIVRRVDVRSLGYKGLNPVYDLKYAAKQISAIRDPGIRQVLAAFCETKPDEAAWNGFCATLRAPREEGRSGPLVKRVSVLVSEETAEYGDLSKDQADSKGGRGAWRRGKRHQGYFVYLDAGERPRVRPVYAFASTHKIKFELSSLPAPARILEFFQSGCTVQLNQDVPHAKTPLKPGRYILNTVRMDGYAVLTNQAGESSQPIGLNKLVPAGLRRCG